MPAIGRRSVASPENVMAKLSRAMIEDVNEDRSVPGREQVSTMIDRVAGQASYDVVLIDSRAGLAELAAPAVTALGATVLFFGTAQTQTIEGYRALFAALQLLAQRDRIHDRSGEWRTALRPVYAKASLNGDTEQQFRDDRGELYSEYLYDAEEEVEGEAQLDLLRSRGMTVWRHIGRSSCLSTKPSLTLILTRQPGQLTAAFYEQSFAHSRCCGQHH
jgi:hypothetical protein